MKIVSGMCIAASVFNACFLRYFILGGEEFLIILPNTDHDGAYKVADTIRETVASLAIKHDQSEVAPHVTLSCGVASLIPSDDWGPELIVSRADKALYKAKELGRNRVCV